MRFFFLLKTKYVYDTENYFIVKIKMLTLKALIEVLLQRLVSRCPKLLHIRRRYLYNSPDCRELITLYLTFRRPHFLSQNSSYHCFGRRIVKDTLSASWYSRRFPRIKLGFRCQVTCNSRDFCSASVFLRFTSSSAKWSCFI